MSFTRVRSIGAIGTLGYAAAALVAACGTPEYFTGDTIVARAGRAGSTGGLSSDGGSETAGAGGSTLGEEGGTSSGGSGGIAGTTAASTGGTTTGASTGGGRNAGGGASSGSAGAGGAGGAFAAGGISSGGTLGVGGISSGGASITGGTNTGGTTVSAGGAATGGAVGAGRASIGGASATGGAATGGASATGGAATGGASATGGAATGGASATGGAATGGASSDPDLVLWYKFDDATGPSAVDSSGNNRTGTLTTAGTGVAAYTTIHQVGTGSLNLTSSSANTGGYVVVPSSLQAMGATTAITISCWVQLKSTRAWQRIFDFGSSSTTSYMFLTAQQNLTSPNSPRFGISTTGNVAEQLIDMTAPVVLSSGVWHHLAVVLGAGATYTGTLYINNVVAGTNNAMTLRPSNLGASTNNWLGRSQFATADPLLNGYLDDFRVYKRAFTAAEVAALYAVR